MEGTCKICNHPKAAAIDSDLAAGYQVVGISVKHFGDRSMVEALDHHKLHLFPSESSEPGAEDVEPRRSPEPVDPASYDEAPDGAIIACEPIRVHGVVYEAGEVIPESAWRPSSLAAALRIGTVRRKGVGPAP